jgi:hypothetical protein
MKRVSKTLMVAVAMLASGALVQPLAQAGSGSNPNASASFNAIVGLWDVQVSITNCANGDVLFSFPALHKFEIGGTGQVVPAGNPTSLSAHMMIWRHVSGGDYLASIKMFRYDGSGNYIGWIELNNEVSINAAADEYEGTGIADIYDAAGNQVGMSCPTLVGTRYTGNF